MSAINIQSYVCFSGPVRIRIGVIFVYVILPNTDILFGLLFRPKRIECEYNFRYISFEKDSCVHLD